MKKLARAPWFGHALAAAGLVIALAVVNVAWIAPRAREERELRARERTLHAEVADLRAGIEEMARWTADHPGVAGGHAKASLAAGAMVASLLDSLGAAGARHGVRTQLIQPAGTPVDEIVADASGTRRTYRKVDLRLRLEAPYREIGAYLSDVESLDLLVVVRSVTLRYDASVAPRLVADVALWIYGRP